MKIEIWSDVVCPFCYIGKRHFEQALSTFSGKDRLEIQWKSFELDPHARPEPGVSLTETLAHKYGQSVEWAEQMQQRVAATASAAGLNFRLDRAMPANTFHAHRLIHFAEQRGKQAEAEERLFKAYFEEGAVVDNPETLIRLAAEIGLNADEVENLLASDEFGPEVRYDEQEAQALGVRGVPFFVIDRKYAISGAQPVEVFQQTLEKAWTETLNVE
ncbi:DsbA family oxidoreductase [Tellurirhabdus rosea]|uniref:DsbA family oxidoreductase n=1 Tax=Tellurirhabdus rosea TaxID=2674997 RepID=UPI0022529DEA|nr:DsbA family oxidoreductase [Tellurirhabdus rosea]